MKILVLSDSHGYYENMYKAIFVEKPDYVIHLGDMSDDAEHLRIRYPLLPILSVRGNCDFGDMRTPKLRLSVYDGVRILATHGHEYGVKGSLTRLYFAAKEEAVHVALFGHTHCAYCEYEDGIWFMNPGPCASRSRGSYGIVEISGGVTTCCTKTMEEYT